MFSMYKPVAVALLGVGLGLGAWGTLEAALDRDAPQPLAPTTQPGGEKHPEMHRALRALRNARKDLDLAAHDYAGHRVAALKAVDDAIKEIEDGLKSEVK